MATSEARTRAKSRVVIFGTIGPYYFGAYEDGDGEWYPMRWNGHGKIWDDPNHKVGLDLEAPPLTTTLPKIKV